MFCTSRLNRFPNSAFNIAHVADERSWARTAKNARHSAPYADWTSSSTWKKTQNSQQVFTWEDINKLCYISTIDSQKTKAADLLLWLHYNNQKLKTNTKMRTAALYALFCICQFAIWRQILNSIFVSIFTKYIVLFYRRWHFIPSLLIFH